MKKLRLAGAATLAEGKPLLPAFIADYNARFAKLFYDCGLLGHFHRRKAGNPRLFPGVSLSSATLVAPAAHKRDNGRVGTRIGGRPVAINGQPIVGVRTLALRSSPQ